MNHMLIVQGTAAVATDACVSHGMNVMSIEYREPYGDCLITVPGTVPVMAMIDWYIEPGLGDGTLIWYALDSVLPSFTAVKTGVPTP